MIKRRFYKLEHTGKDEVSDSSSSSSESEHESEDTRESVGEEVEAKEDDESHSISSGYEREDSSGNEVDLDKSGALDNEDVTESGKVGQFIIKNKLSDNINAGTGDTQSTIASADEALLEDIPDCILRCKSIFKCKICPRIVCLSEESVRAHLTSKRHSRSEKLLNDGRLKSILNSDGEVENQETASELHARVVSRSQGNPKRKNRGRQRQRKRSTKKNVGPDSNEQQTRKSTESSSKKRHKKEN